MFFKRKQKPETIFVLHIGSASVGGMIFRKNQDGKMEILTDIRQTANFLLDVDFEAFWRCIRNAMKGVIDKIKNEVAERPDKVICVFSSPWFVSQTKIAQIKRDESFEVTRELFDKLAKNEIDIFLRYWQGHMEPLEGAASLIENKVMKTSLNGYPTADPIGKTSKSLQIYLYASLGIKELKDSILQDVAGHYGKIPVFFFTLPFVVFNVMDMITNAKEGYVFVEIGRETTDISLVRNNVLEETISFGKGRGMLLRRISSQMKTLIEEVPSLLSNYHSGQLDSGVSQKISSIVAAASDDWFSSFKDAVGMISDKSPLPQNLFVIGNEPIDRDYVKRAENQDIAKFTIFEKPFSINYILPESLNNYFSSQTNVKNKDIFLALEAIFVSKNKIN